jgi:uncharacterized repeat protein (TIGR01451 family)
MSSEAIRGFFRGRATRLAVIFVFLLSAALVCVLARGGPAVPAAPPDPDLSLTKADSPDPVNAGAQLTYTLTVTNNGPESATNTVVTDDLPNEVTFNSATASSGTCDDKGKKVTCNLGTIAPTASATVTIKVTVKGNTKASQISNTASVASDGSDPSSANNSDTEATTVLKAGAGGFTCFNKKATIVGTPGNDVLVGTPGNDVIRTFGGDDSVSSGDGKDLICTNGGTDSVNSGAREDRVKAGGGPDLIKGRADADELRGNRGPDRLRGNRGPDLLVGGRGIDSCRGGPGGDTLLSCERH